MQTAMLFINYDELSYHVIDKDVSHLDGVYILDSEDQDEDSHGDDDLERKQAELSSLIFQSEKEDPTDLSFKVTKEEFVQAIRDGANLIECGFLIP
jgi:hypothetical protein